MNDYRPTDDDVQRGADALRYSDALTGNDDGTPTHYVVDAENVEYLTAVILAAVLPAHDERVRAEALREAADDLATLTNRVSVARWLRARAEQIGADDE
jgi:hypothetical protein